MNPPTMQALLFDQAGAAEDVLRFGTAPRPVPGPGQLLVRVCTRVIQPADRLFIAGRYRVRPRFPQVAGFDGAGVVEETGAGCDPALRGRKVAFRGVGAWAEFAVAAAERTHPVPDGIDLRQACQFTLNPLTAWGLLATARIRRGQRLLATAGDSSVARWIAALGSERTVHVTLASREEGGWRASTAASGVAVRATSFAQLLEALTRERGFDAILDPIGGPATLDLIEACVPGGSLVSYGVLDDRPFELQAARILYRNLRWVGFGIDQYLDRAGTSEITAARETVWRLMREQPGLTSVAAIHSLRDHAAALSDSTRLARRGKVLFADEPTCRPSARSAARPG